MNNNKGQSLVLFVLIIPILLGIMALTIDVGTLISKKNSLDNITEFVLEYSLDQDEITTSEITTLMNYNTKENISKVTIEDKVIYISSKTYIKGIFSKILGFQEFEIKSEYKGYLVEETKNIEKLK